MVELTTHEFQHTAYHLCFCHLGSELVNTSVAKKAGQAVRLLMMVLTAVLIFFFINVMLLVSDIQGTARVVNYAGLVRGTTQRIVKLEDAPASR